MQIHAPSCFAAAKHVISNRYISIRIPSVSENENHPFSIASAPGDEELQVVIKVVGDWTGELRRQVENGTVCPGVMVAVFGPYGAPAQSVFKYKSVILVCGGIGVTPFASILQFFNSNLQHDSESFDHTNPRHGQTPGRHRSMTFAENAHVNHLATLQHDARTQEVQFIWVCSDLSSVSWFTDVLKGPSSQFCHRNYSALSTAFFFPLLTRSPSFPDIHLNQKSQVCTIRIKIYITSLPGERLDTMAFHLARRMFFDACGYDAFCGLAEPCCCGRPDWFEVFTEASKQNDAKHKGNKGACALLDGICAFWLGLFSCTPALFRHCSHVLLLLQRLVCSSAGLRRWKKISQSASRV